MSAGLLLLLLGADTTAVAVAASPDNALDDVLVRVPAPQPVQRRIFAPLPETVEGACAVTFAPLALDFHARALITDVPPAVIEGTLDLACELPDLTVEARGIVLDDEATLLRVIAAALAEASLI